MDLGGCEERLPEESRWAAKARGSRQRGAREEGRIVRSDELRTAAAGYLLEKNSERRGWQGVERFVLGKARHKGQDSWRAREQERVTFRS